MASVTVIGAREFEAALLKVLVEVPPLAAETLYQDVTNLVMRPSLRIAPIDTGYMRSTAIVGQPEVKPEEAVVEAGYGASYSIFVHENQEAQHNPPTQAKFLEQPANAAAPAIFASLGAMLARLLTRRIVL